MRLQPRAQWQGLRERWGDWRAGARTYDYLTPAQLGLDADGHEYTPTRYPVLRKLLDCVPPEFRGAGFLDFGCGLGRVLVAAHGRGFAPVIGVERSPQLCERARAIVAGLPVTIVQDNAAAVAIPASVRVLFLFNPFHGPTLAETIRRIEQHAAAAPCLILVANQAAFAAVVSSRPSFTRLRHGRRGRVDWAVYRAAAAVPAC